MTLALLSHDLLLPPPSMRQRVLSQWWTPEDVAARLVEWAGPLPHGASILEPSAGGGALVRAALARHPSSHVTAVEIDPTVQQHLRAIESPMLDVVCADYMQYAPPTQVARIYMNPPYEGGADGVHVARAMTHATEVVALLRLAALAGRERNALVWSQVGAGEWWLRGLAIFTSRPSFLAAGEATGVPLSDFCAVHLTRERYDARQTHMEWW